MSEGRTLPLAADGSADGAAPSGASAAPARGIKAQLARTFVNTLGRVENPQMRLLGLTRAESFVPAGPAGLALLHEFATYPGWPARTVAAQLLGERSAAGSAADQNAVWQTLVHLAADPERWVREATSWSFGALLRANPERWGPHFLAAFAPAEEGLAAAYGAESEDEAPEVGAAVRRALLFGVVPALRRGPDEAQRVAVELIDRAAGEDSSATRQLGALIVARELAVELPETALDLLERWVQSNEIPRQWQVARSLTAPLRAAAPERTAAIIRQLERVDDPRVRNALRGALKDGAGEGGNNGSDHGDGGEDSDDGDAAGEAAAYGHSAFRRAAQAQTGLSRTLMPPADWQTTAEIPISERIIDQVVGQDRSVEIIRLAAQQKRFVLMVGEPGTGKSMLAAAMAEMMGAHDLEDVLVVPNQETRINPLLEVVPAGEGEQIVRDAKKRRSETETSISYLFGVALVAVSLIAAWYSFTTKSATPGIVGAVIAVVLLGVRRFFRSPGRLTVPKLLVNNARALEVDLAPFVDATGFHAGALLGDVRHDPFQSGGYETPPHDLVEPGAIHLAHRGVLFIDEVSTLSIESQQSLLTAIQEKRFPISGRTLGSSGTMIRTNPAPCDFLLILAGNMQDVEKMHPALRSRVRGYGYELYMNEEMPDTPDNRAKLARFCAQEVTKDRKIPHLRRDAVDAVVEEARVRTGRPDRLTTRLRELGGLIRAAGDLAAQEGVSLVEPRHVLAARENTRTLEEQIARRQPPVTPSAEFSGASTAPDETAMPAAPVDSATSDVPAALAQEPPAGRRAA